MNPPAFRYRAVAKQRHSWTAVSLCWIVSSLLGFTPLLGWNNFPLEPLNSTNASPSALGSRPCTFLSVVSLPFMVYFNFLGCVMTPLLVITLLYARVFWSLQGRLRDSCPQTRASLLRERRLACSLSLVLILFTGCWIPLHLMNCLLLFAGPDAVPQGAVYTGRRARLRSFFFVCFFGLALFVSELLYKLHLFHPGAQELHSTCHPSGTGESYGVNPLFQVSFSLMPIQQSTQLSTLIASRRLNKPAVKCGGGTWCTRGMWTAKCRDQEQRAEPIKPRLLANNEQQSFFFFFNTCNVSEDYMYRM